MVMELRTHRSMRELSEADWDSLLATDSVPHMRWAFLEALEATGCVRPEVGWLPQHLSLYRDGKLVGVAPAYVKGNSEGEFVFDHSWARFCHENLGAEYFPKLIVAVPFTPATGPRLLCAAAAASTGELHAAELHAAELHAAELHAALAQGLAQLIDNAGLSSGHVLFLREESAAHFEQAGLCRRFGVQYHWRNAGYASFDDFLSRFSSKRRHQLRRERRELSEQGIELQLLSGDELGSDLIDHVYEFYAATVDKHFYGRRYLNRAFFHEICARMPKQILVVLAREKGVKKPLGCAFNLVSSRALFGRYWGAREERPFLHFNVCYYAGIEACIDRGLEYFEPGAGGEHKHARGFESTLTHSVHYLRDPRLRIPVERFLSQERAAIVEHLQTEKPLFKVELG
jgi:predicted N-acyltransferase